MILPLEPRFKFANGIVKSSLVILSVPSPEIVPAFHVQFELELVAISNVAPEAIVAAPVQKAEAFVILTAPSEIVFAPERELAPESVRVPLPVFSIAPAPETCPERVRL